MTLRDDLTITTGTSATKLTDDLGSGINPHCNRIVLKADKDNAADIIVGNEESQSMHLEPGDRYPIDVNSTDGVYYKAASGSPKLQVHIYQ